MDQLTREDFCSILKLAWAEMAVFGAGGAFIFSSVARMAPWQKEVKVATQRAQATSTKGVLEYSHNVSSK